jgi:hypothetical protein
MRPLEMFVLAIVLSLAGLATAEGKIPQTTADHLAMAQKYQDKAAAYRQEAADHREMAESYKARAVPAGKGTDKNPWVKKMEDHCRAFIVDAEKLAADAERAAEYHTLRARELQGK